MDSIIVPVCQLKAIRSSRDGGWVFTFEAGGDKESGLIMAALSLMRDQNLSLEIKGE